jgi:hypothetical protein
MLGGTIQEPCIQKAYLRFLLTDPTKTPTCHSLRVFSVFLEDLLGIISGT